MMGSIVAIGALQAIATGKAPKARLVPFTRITKDNVGSWIPWPQRPKLTVVVK
jgi:hypothetical protein